MHFVHEVGGVAYPHQRTARIDIVLPAIELLVILEGQVVSLFLGLQKQAIRLQVHSFNVGDISQADRTLLGCALE